MAEQTMMTTEHQTDWLVRLGLHAMAGMTEHAFRQLSRPLAREAPGILAVHPRLVPASRMTTLLTRGAKSGFVVEDMTDLDEFEPLEGLPVSKDLLYLVRGVERGDDMLNWSPEEALGAITARGRRPLTVAEGISWLLQQPEQLEPNRCFMTIGSRKRNKRGLDARTPAIWISNGTGRDGAARRGAPKVGWCWARNRHTWLGFASAER